MTYIKTALIIIILYTVALYSQESTDMNFQDLYAKMKDKYSSIYPKHFEAYISGKIVQRQIDTIPAKSYTKTKNDIKLKFSFTQGSTPSIVLENVDSFYRNMFSVFEGALETIGFYTLVGSSSSYDSLSKKFTFESLEESKNKYEITLRAKGENLNYSVVYTVDKEILLIEKAEYYNKKSKIYDVSISYENIENYTLPKIIKYKSSDGKVNSEIEFTDIKF
ncbi:hypothetical protein [Brachyspira sp. G79]|uniref:hypothetical protein n=1 Tax=Brachyspira sp. G79 TaxID=1358104 RepID=UPI000BBBA294|nr:hypothetical protein [Brachyspira sp. G79]PCG19550.1 hypothetical protein KQ44_05530 [Brachyspira sp. G79]